MNGYRVLLRLAPRRLRARHGAEMEALFRSRLADARAHGLLAPAAIWIQALGDILVSMPHELILLRRRRGRAACLEKGVL